MRDSLKSLIHSNPKAIPKVTKDTKVKQLAVQQASKIGPDNVISMNEEDFKDF